MTVQADFNPESSSGETSVATEKQTPMTVLESGKPLKITLISLHGLIRAHDCELGRDADTGGQIKYVLELAKELAEYALDHDAQLLA